MWAIPPYRGSGQHRIQYSDQFIAIRYLLVPIAIGVMILAAMFGLFGVGLVYIGATGATNLKMFGQSVETADVGVVSIFVGGVMVVLVLRRLMGTFEVLIKGSDTTSSSIEDWGPENTETTVIIDESKRVK